MTFDNIPEPMKAFPRWVVRKGKIPYNPNTGQCAKAGQPQTWGRYEEAVDALNTNQYSGLGFQFHKDGFVGVDFDNCIKDGVLDNWVVGWIERFNSYTEISPSGKGIHIICIGNLPDKAVKRPQAEMYDHSRYFTITGEVLGAARPLRRAQEAINALYQELTAQKQQKPAQASVDTITLDDSKLLDIAAKAKNGSTFTRLYSGDWQGLYQSQSEADVALCNILAFYTGKMLCKWIEFFAVLV